MVPEHLTGKNRKIFVAAAAGLLLACGFYFSFRYYTHFKEIRRQQEIFRMREAAWERLRIGLGREIFRFKGQAGIVVKDLKFNRELFYRKDFPFPSASLVKLPIMAACFSAVREGRLDLSRQVALKSSDKFGGSGMLKSVRPGTVFTVEELIGLMIYESDNTATNILTTLLGMDYLNSAFVSLGLTNTNLSRRVADFRSRDRGIENYTTAEDVSSILERIYRGTLIDREVSEQCLRMLKLQRVNDRLPRYLPADITVAHKTGLERNVCHDAGIIFFCGGDFLVCVLTRHNNPHSYAAKKFIARVGLRVYDFSLEISGQPVKNTGPRRIGKRRTD
ncbi:MAG: serine hydrolase [Candidatus Omnitrophota bacterium]|jgi:beta-lactamase class A